MERMGITKLLDIWLRHFFVWPGPPPIGNPFQADVIVVQSFGRNKYRDSELFLVRKIYEEAGKDDLKAIGKLKETDYFQVGVNLKFACLPTRQENCENPDGFYFSCRDFLLFKNINKKLPRFKPCFK